MMELLARRRRTAGIHPGTRTVAYLPPAALRDGLICVIHRDTRGCELSPLQAFTYGTVTPNMALAWYWQGRPEQLLSWAPDNTTADRTPVEGPIRVVGGCTRPWIHYSAQPYNVLIAVFRPDAMRKWFDVDPVAWTDRTSCVEDLGADLPWAAWARAILAAGEPTAALPVLYGGLLEARAGCAGAAPGPIPSVQWLDRVTYSTRSAHLRASVRTGQRELRRMLGISERRARKLARLEALTIATAERTLRSQPTKLAELASAANFYDQAQLSRDVLGASGFTATEAMRRAVADESFWLLRAFYSIFIRSLVRKPLDLIPRPR